MDMSPRVLLALAGLAAAGCRTGDDLPGPTDAPAVVDAAGDDAAVVDAAPDAAPDAPVDAADVDAAIDALTVDAGVDARPVDAASPGPVLAPFGALESPGYHDLGPIVPMPGNVSGGIYFCNTESLVDQHAYLRRHQPGGPPGAARVVHSSCADVVALDASRAAMAANLGWGGPRPRVIISDGTQSSPPVIELPTPTGLGLVFRLQRLPGGLLASGVSLTGWNDPAPVDLIWRLDEQGVVLDTWTGRRAGTVLSTSPPAILLARLEGGNQVAVVDLETGTVVGTETVPFTPREILAGGGRAHVVGELGGSLAYAPLGASIPTVLPGVPPTSPHGLDLSGRLLVAVDAGDDRHVVVHRLDEAHFDGVDGSSRRDPTFGTGGSATAELGRPCWFLDPCDPPAWWERSLQRVGTDSAGRLVLGGSMAGYPGTAWVVVFQRYATPP